MEFDPFAGLCDLDHGPCIKNCSDWAQRIGPVGRQFWQGEK